MTTADSPKRSLLPSLAVGAIMLCNTVVLLFSAPVLLLLLAEGASSLDTHPDNLAFVVLCGSALLLWPLSALAGWVLLAFGRWGLTLGLQVAAAMLVGCAGFLGVIATAVVS